MLRHIINRLLRPDMARAEREKHTRELAILRCAEMALTVLSTTDKKRGQLSFRAEGDLSLSARGNRDGALDLTVVHGDLPVLQVHAWRVINHQPKHPDYFISDIDGRAYRMDRKVILRGQLWEHELRQMYVRACDTLAKKPERLPRKLRLRHGFDEAAGNPGEAYQETQNIIGRISSSSRSDQAPK